MKQFTSVADVPDVEALITKALTIKGKQLPDFAKGKNLSMLFFNPSLRTRMSTQAAANNLGMNVSVLDAGQGWKLELEEGAVMDGDTQEHIKDAIRVLSSYSDVLAVRAFPGLSSRDDDYSEKILNQCIRYSNKPVLSLESATRHPLQSLADVMTIHEQGIKKPKIAVTWAPHPKKIPHCVVNSFLEWSAFLDADVWLAHPEGYELAPEFVSHTTVTNNQAEALADADFVYCKNWSSYTDYGNKLPVEGNWTVDQVKMDLTNKGRIMHCLPVRRNVEATDEVLDNGLIYKQAENRLWAAQAVLMELLKQ